MATARRGRAASLGRRVYRYVTAGPIVSRPALIFAVLGVDLVLLVVLGISFGFDLARLALGHFAFLTVATLGAFVADKVFSRMSMRRVSERNLLTLCFLGGGGGGLLGLLLARHKRRSLRFRVLVPIAVIVNALCAVYAFQ